jgi:hypothetical protein
MQNVQLMAKDENFGFQSFMRTKAVPHISKQKFEEGHHQFSIMIRFSFLLRIQRMRFSEGTSVLAVTDLGPLSRTRRRFVSSLIAKSKFPVSSEKFPVLMRREFGRRAPTGRMPSLSDTSFGSLPTLVKASGRSPELRH